MASDNDLVTASIKRDHYKTALTARNHQLMADEPLDIGGTDLGPAPYQFMNAALASCTAITLRMYADHKQWAVEQIDVDVSHRKETIEHTDESGSTSNKLDRIERRISLSGEIDQSQLDRLLKIANRCPLHQTLSSKSTLIETKIVLNRS